MLETKQLPIRLPLDLKAWLAEQAALNGSSQNSEVVRAVRERMNRVGRPPEMASETADQGEAA